MKKWVLILGVVRLVFSTDSVDAAFRNHYRTELHEAVRARDHDRVTQILAHGGDVNIEDSELEGGCTPLILAALSCHPGNVRALIGAHADLNASDDQGNTALHHAARDGSLSIVKILVEARCNLSVFNQNGLTPLDLARNESQRRVVGYLEQQTQNEPSDLLRAAAAGKLGRVRELLGQQNGDVGQLDDLDNTALHWASAHGYVAVVEELLNAGAHVNAVARDGGTPLHRAVAGNRAQVVEVLCDQGARVDIGDRRGNREPLALVNDATDERILTRLYLEGGRIRVLPIHLQEKMYAHLAKIMREAIEDDNLGFVHTLLEKDTSLASCTFENGLKPIHVATIEDKQTILRELVHIGRVDIDEPDRWGRTVAHCVAQTHNSALFDFLESLNATFDRTDTNGNTPLHVACALGNEVMVRKLITVARSSITSSNAQGDQPLHLAASQGNEAVVELLCENGADKSAKDSGERTALFRAAHEGHTEVIRLLHRTSANLDESDVRGTTPLQCAISNQHQAAAELLCQLGASVDVRDSLGNTALHSAAHVGDVRMCSQLLEMGADPNVQNNQGSMPIHVAVALRHVSVVQTLCTYSQNHQNGLELSVANRNGETPFFLAHELGSNEMKELLAQSDALAHEHRDQLQALFDSIRLRNVSLVEQLAPTIAAQRRELLLVHFLEGREPYSGHNALGYVCFVAKLDLENSVADVSKSNDIVRALITAMQDNSIDLSVKESDGTGQPRTTTPLHVFARDGNQQLVDFVLGRGDSGVNTLDSLGQTPLYLATRNGYASIVAQLLKASADPFLKVRVQHSDGEDEQDATVSGVSPMELVCSFQGIDSKVLTTYLFYLLEQPDIDRISTSLTNLSNAPFDQSLTNEGGETILHVLLRRTSEEKESRSGNEKLLAFIVLRTLSTRDFDVTQRDGEGRLPIFWVEKLAGINLRELEIDGLNELLQAMSLQEFLIQKLSPTFRDSEGNATWETSMIGMNSNVREKCERLKNRMSLADLSVWPAGILFEGSPGCGKATVARALSDSMEAQFCDLRKYTSSYFSTKRTLATSEKLAGFVFDLYHSDACGSEDMRPSVIFLGNVDEECSAFDNGRNVNLVCQRMIDCLRRCQQRKAQHEEKLVTVIATTRDRNKLDQDFLNCFNTYDIIVFANPSRDSRISLLNYLLLGRPKINITQNELVRVAEAASDFNYPLLEKLVTAVDYARVEARDEHLNFAHVVKAAEEIFIRHFVEDDGKQARKILHDEYESVSFNDVVGADDVVNVLRQKVQELRGNEMRVDGMEEGFIILHGPPGTGKTTLAQAFANEAECTYVKKVASDFVGEVGIGSCSKAIKDFFLDARQRATAAKPCVVFIDEIDAIAGFEASLLDTSNGVNAAVDHERIASLTQLFTSIEDFINEGYGVVVGATNFYSRLDSRFKSKCGLPINVSLPNEDGRLQILGHMIRSVRDKGRCRVHEELQDVGSLIPLAQQTGEFSGRNLKQFVKRALHYKTQNHAQCLMLSHFNAVLPFLQNEVDEERRNLRGEQDAVQDNRDELAERERLLRQQHRDAAWQSSMHARQMQEERRRVEEMGRAIDTRTLSSQREQRRICEENYRRRMELRREREQLDENARREREEFRRAQENFRHNSERSQDLNARETQRLREEGRELEQRRQRFAEQQLEATEAFSRREREMKEECRRGVIQALSEQRMQYRLERQQEEILRERGIESRRELDRRGIGNSRNSSVPRIEWQ